MQMTVTRFGGIITRVLVKQGPNMGHNLQVSVYLQNCLFQLRWKSNVI